MTMRWLARTVRESTLALLAIAAVMLPGVLRAPAMVGGAQPAADGAGRSVVMDSRLFRHSLHGDRGGAHAVAHRGALRAAGAPTTSSSTANRAKSLSEVPLLKDVARIERDPQFDLKRLFAHLATADVALIKLVDPLPARIPPVRSRRNRNRRGGRHAHVAGLWRHRARRRAAAGGVVRAGSLVVTGQPEACKSACSIRQPKGQSAGLPHGACAGDSGARRSGATRNGNLDDLSAW